jgi:hypothetical protein
LAEPPERHAFDGAFLLDVGSLVVTWVKLLDASDPEVKSFEDSFVSDLTIYCVTRRPALFLEPFSNTR